MHLELLLDQLDDVGLLEGGGPAPQHGGTLLCQRQEQRLNRKLNYFPFFIPDLVPGPHSIHSRDPDSHLFHQDPN